MCMVKVKVEEEYADASGELADLPGQETMTLFMYKVLQQYTQQSPKPLYSNAPYLLPGFSG